MIHYSRYATALAIAVLAMPVAAGCTGDSLHASKPQTAASVAPDKTAVEAPAVRSPGKRGAPVTLSWYVDGKPRVGEPVAIELDLRAQRGDVSNLSLQISAEAGLEVVAGGGDVALAARAPEGPYGHRLLVTPRAAGLAHVHVVAVVNTSEGRQLRSFAVPVTTGDGAERATKAAGHIETDADGRRVRVLPATGDAPD